MPYYINTSNLPVIENKNHAYIESLVIIKEIIIFQEVYIAFQ